MMLVHDKKPVRRMSYGMGTITLPGAYSQRENKR